MKQFFKFMFASLLGFLLGIIILFFISLGMIASLASMGKKGVTEVKNQSVLHLSFDKEVVDRGGANPFDNFDFFSMSPTNNIGLNDLLNNLKKAKEDDRIEGILLDLSVTRAGWASVDEIRQGLIDFKESGKFILSYGEFYSQNSYYLASVADEIFLHPEGLVDFRGINLETMFFKGTLERLGIDPQIIRHGEYKSAGEPFFLDQMSAENRGQLEAIAGNVWNNILSDIGSSRQLSLNHLTDVANGFLSRTAELALENDMIDGIRHRDELRAHINEKLGNDPDEDIAFITLDKYENAPMPKSMVTPRSRDKIAVIYGSGTILTGEGSERIIGSKGTAEAIREARMDSTVKAIVLRINSPGGDAMASDVILREVKLAAETKPVIASMGDVAASGGYYIAVGAHKIVASPNTITGSIGVFGMFPNMQEFFNEKLGVTFDNVKTSLFADLGSVSRPLSHAERALFQEQVDRIYDTFTGHVSDGRQMPITTVNELGGGRVWSGTEARQHGLIDGFGGLLYAIEQAAEMAELDNYRIVNYPKRKDLFTRIMEDFGGISERRIEKKLGTAYPIYRQIQEINQMNGVLTRMPFDIIME